MDTDKQLHRILAATDGSQAADRAVSFAGGLAAACGAALVVLTVDDEVASRELQMFGRIEHVATGELLETQHQAILARARALAVEAGVKDVTTMSETGDPATNILDAAKKTGASLIVTGRRGCGQLEGLLLGSVSQKLASQAPCPMLIVP